MRHYVTRRRRACTYQALITLTIKPSYGIRLHRDNVWSTRYLDNISNMPWTRIVRWSYLRSSAHNGFRHEDDCGCMAGENEESLLEAVHTIVLA